MKPWLRILVETLHPVAYDIVACTVCGKLSQIEHGAMSYRCRCSAMQNGPGVEAARSRRRH